MKKIMKRTLVLVMAVVMAMTAVPTTAKAASKVKLNKTKATLTITDKKPNPTVNLKVKRTSAAAKWSSSDKSVATVKKGKVTAKGAGKATITCKVKGKKLTCKVTVVDKSKGLEIILKNTGASKDKKNYGPPTIKDTQMRVMYNGKDVTKKAKCGVQYEPNPYNATYYENVDKNGNIMIYGSENQPKNIKLIAVYKSMKKTIKAKAIITKHRYYKCQCGEIFDTDQELTEHTKAIIANKGPGYGIEYHGQWFTYYYTVVTVTKR